MCIQCSCYLGVSPNEKNKKKNTLRAQLICVLRMMDSMSLNYLTKDAFENAIKRIKINKILNNATDIGTSDIRHPIQYG